jgi:hypothetical protein
MRNHHSHRVLIPGYCFSQCRRGFSGFTGIDLYGIKRRRAELLFIVCGIARDVPTAQLARVADCDRSELRALSRWLQGAAVLNRDRMPLDDREIEADEARRNANERGRAARRPRRAAASARQRGLELRPFGQRPAAGLQSGQAHEQPRPVAAHSGDTTLEKVT